MESFETQMAILEEQNKNLENCNRELQHLINLSNEDSETTITKGTEQQTDIIDQILNLLEGKTYGEINSILYETDNRAKNIPLNFKK